MSQREEKITATIMSNRGFYIGDVCYALSKKNYHDIWGGKNKFKSGKIDMPGGMTFAVASTDIGDGLYEDNEKYLYPVDAANIGVVPLELCEADLDALSLGRVVEISGKAIFEAQGGVFDITLPDESHIHIDTSYWSNEEWIPSGSKRRHVSHGESIGGSHEQGF